MEFISTMDGTRTNLEQAFLEQVLESQTFLLELMSSGEAAMVEESSTQLW